MKDTCLTSCILKIMCPKVKTSKQVSLTFQTFQLTVASRIEVLRENPDKPVLFFAECKAIPTYNFVASQSCVPFWAYFIRNLQNT